MQIIFIFGPACHSSVTVDIYFAVFNGTKVSNNWFKFFQGIANGSYMHYWVTRNEAFKIHSEIVCLITTCYHLIIWLGFFDTSPPNDKTHILQQIYLLRLEGHKNITCLKQNPKLYWWRICPCFWFCVVAGSILHRFKFAVQTVSL